MSEWTAKKAAILGVVFSGTSVALLCATAVAMHWQQGRQGQKDWGIVFAAAFGVPFMCSTAAAILSFVVSASLLAYKRFFAFQQIPSSLAAIPDLYRRRLRRSPMMTLGGFAVLIVSARFGPAALFLVGIPAMLIACGIAGGARSPAKIPLKDAILYVGISVAIVTGIAVYVVYHH